MSITTAQRAALLELIESARGCAATDDTDAMYEDSDSGQTHRCCCHAVYRFYPHVRINSHAEDCNAVRLSTALAGIADFTASLLETQA